MTNTPKRRYSATSALAMYFCIDSADLRESRYQPSHTTGAVYTLSDVYWCCVPIGKQPYQDRTSGVQWDWQPYVRFEGYQIWRAGTQPKEAA